MQNPLRPDKFTNFIGQNKVVKTLKVMIDSAKQRKTTLDHILFYGPPGLGKTTLATIIANEMEATIKYAQGPLLEKKSDILTLFASVSDGSIIFIDEIHGLNKNIEELLYSAIEDGFIDLTIGTEGDSKIIRMKLPKFTLIGATTKIGKLSIPLKDRFGILFKLNSYNDLEICKILKRVCKIYKFILEEDSLFEIAKCSRMTPRIAINILKRIYDYKISLKQESVDKYWVWKIFREIGIYKNGLTEQHISYLDFLRNNDQNKFSSIDLISGSIFEQKETIESEIEPLLLKNELIEKSSRGRKITKAGIEYLKNSHF